MKQREIHCAFSVQNIFAKIRLYVFLSQRDIFRQGWHDFMKVSFLLTQPVSILYRYRKPKFLFADATKIVRDFSVDQLYKEFNSIWISHIRNFIPFGSVI